MEISDIREVETLDDWHALAADLREDEYAIWQMQYRYSQPEGFHAWFWAKGRPELHIVTHSEEAQSAIVNYRVK